MVYLFVGFRLCLHRPRFNLHAYSHNVKTSVFEFLISHRVPPLPNLCLSNIQEPRFSLEYPTRIAIQVTLCYNSQQVNHIIIRLQNRCLERSSTKNQDTKNVDPLFVLFCFNHTLRSWSLHLGIGYILLVVLPTLQPLRDKRDHLSVDLADFRGLLEKVA